MIRSTLINEEDRIVMIFLIFKILKNASDCSDDHVTIPLNEAKSSRYDSLDFNECRVEFVYFSFSESAPAV